MSLVALGMDGLLATLLVTALAVGLRLNNRLKALREGQAGFVRAVGELDAAAARAEAGLAALRAATMEAHDNLLDRIDTARKLAQRLEHAVGEAETAAARAERAAAAPPPLRAPAPSAPAPVLNRPGVEAVFDPAPASRRRLEPSAVEAAPVEAEGPLARFVARRLGGRP